MKNKLGWKGLRREWRRRRRMCKERIFNKIHYGCGGLAAAGETVPVAGPVPDTPTIALRAVR